MCFSGSDTSQVSQQQIQKCSFYIHCDEKNQKDLQLEAVRGINITKVIEFFLEEQFRAKNDNFQSKSGSSDYIQCIVNVF